MTITILILSHAANIVAAEAVSFPRVSLFLCCGKATSDISSGVDNLLRVAQLAGKYFPQTMVDKKMEN